MNCCGKSDEDKYTTDQQHGVQQLRTQQRRTTGNHVINLQNTTSGEVYLSPSRLQRGSDNIENSERYFGKSFTPAKDYPLTGPGYPVQESQYIPRPSFRQSATHNDQNLIMPSG